MAGSFKTDVQPLFNQPAIKHMGRLSVFLDKYDWMSNPAGDGTYPDHANANHVYARLAGTTDGPRMPPGGPYWNDAQLKTLSNWMNVDPKYEP